MMQKGCAQHTLAERPQIGITAATSLLRTDHPLLCGTLNPTPAWQLLTALHPVAIRERRTM